MSKTYSELLLDPRWQRKRLEVFEFAKFACEECLSETETLHAHHKIYRKGAMPWEYEDWEIACLCRKCHQEQHAIRERISEAIKELPSHLLNKLADYAEELTFL